MVFYRSTWSGWFWLVSNLMVYPHEINPKSEVISVADIPSAHYSIFNMHVFQRKFAKFTSALQLHAGLVCIYTKKLALHISFKQAPEFSLNNVIKLNSISESQQGIKASQLKAHCFLKDDFAKWVISISNTS